MRAGKVEKRCDYYSFDSELRKTRAPPLSATSHGNVASKISMPVKDKTFIKNFGKIQRFKTLTLRYKFQ